MSIGYQFDPGRIIRLWSSYTSTGLRSFSDADAGYRYLSVSLTVGWAF